jgi:signal transduction histidine kinase
MKGQVRRDLGALARAARLRSRTDRAILQLLIAGIASVWIGWWALVWIIGVQVLERFVEPLVTRAAASRLDAGEPRKAQAAMMGLRAATGAAYALGWAPAWAVGGAEAGFFAGAMLVGAFINALVYFSNSRAVFYAALAPPLLAGVLVPAVFHGVWGATLLVLPILLVVLLRTHWAQRDQLALFESVDNNRSARILAEAENRAKSQFLATVTHELRTPLNAIINYAEMLEEDLSGLRRESVSDAERIRRAGLNLLGLVDGVLDYALIEAGDVRIERSSADVRVVLTSVVSAAGPLATVAGNSLEAQFSDEIAVGNVDERRLRECLNALLSNACRFTREGKVIVAARHYWDADQRMLEVAVEDTGCGIPVEVQQRIFEPFQQVNGSRTRTHGGFGLSLATAKRLAELMGGTLSVTSAPGWGSRFVLVIACDFPASAELRQCAA